MLAQKLDNLTEEIRVKVIREFCRSEIFYENNSIHSILIYSLRYKMDGIIGGVKERTLHSLIGLNT